MGKYNKETDSYGVELQECSEKNENQIFILFNDHGRDHESEITVNKRAKVHALIDRLP